MTARPGRVCVALLSLGMVVALGGAGLEPAAPVVPAAIVAALQEGRAAEAVKGLDDLIAASKGDDERAYYQLLRGTALRLTGRRDAARDALTTALDAQPRGRWVAKLRSELTAVAIADGRFADAEALARAEAERLLAGDRKDRLAEVYHAFARQLLKPDDPVAPPDPNAAYDLLVQARALAKGDPLRAELLYAMGRASQAAGNPGRALTDFQGYLNEWPKGADRVAVRFHLGESQQAAGQPPAARLTWTDLARDLDKKGITKDEDGLRALALFAIGSTYGIPNPPDDANLNLGVAAVRRALAAYPAHPRAVIAAYDIGAAYLARGKSQEALAALTAFLKEEGFRAETDEAKRDLTQRTMTATFQVGQVLQGQQKFAEAIAAWQGYLAKFPNGPQSADAQRAILDTQLLSAADLFSRERYADARNAWRAFAVANPLDGRVPQVLFQVGESFVNEKQFDSAIDAWGPLLGKFPGSEPAAHAQFLIASLFENEKGEPAAAIERFKGVAVEPWRASALQRVAVMEAKALTVVTPRTFRSGEKAFLKITSRNLEKLTITAYKLNAESYFRKKHELGAVEALDIGLVRPDAEWTAAVPGYAKYKPVESDYELKVDVPGAYVVKVTDEKALQATTLVLGSDLDAIVKVSREQLLVFAQDMKTGAGRPGARVLVSDGSAVILEAKTGKDGVLLTNWEHPRDPNAGLQYLVIDAKDVAGSGLGVPGTVAQGLTARAYLATDRPAYRPGQRVALRGVVREVNEGQYANTPGAIYRLEVTDSRGRQLVSRPVTLSAFGTFHEELPLDSAAPVGTYRMRVYQPGKSDFSGQFEVQAYQLQPIDLSFDLKQTVFYRGETIEADLVAKYQYGAPVAHRPIVVQLPDGRTLQGATDASGKYHVTLTTAGFAEEQPLLFRATLPQDNVATAARVLLAVRGFSISPKTTRDVYLDGESFQVQATTLDARGEPIGAELSVAVLKQVTQAGRVTEREVGRKPLKTDPKTGAGAVAVQVDDDQGGSYLLRLAGTDRFGNPVVADRALSISGKKDETRLRLLADRQTYKVGEEATVNLHGRGRGGVALLTWEADRILTYKLVKIEEGDNAVAWTVDGAQFPNFTLTAARMAGARFDEARLDVRVERDLRVSIVPKQPTAAPGAPVEVEITTTDQLGRPVAAEIALALVDRALLRLHADNLPPIGTYFYHQTRTGAFATRATNTFRYEPATTPVSEAVVEDAEQTAARASNAVGRKGAVEEAQNLAINMPAPAPAGAVAFGLDAAGVEHDFRRKDTLSKSAEDGVVAQLQDAEGLGEADGKKGLGYNVPREFRELAESRKSGLGLARLSDSKAERQAQPRQRFVETAYWNPSIVTDKAGKARVTLDAPMALSAYRFTARGVTGNETLVGQATAEIVVKKDFFVDLKTPSALTQGDRPRFIARVHHLGATGVAALKLSIYAGGREQVFPKTIDVKTDGIDEVLFDPFDVPDGDVVRLSLGAALGESKDELVAEVPIRPWGAQAIASASGASSDDATVFVGLPPGRAYEAPEMLIVVSPSPRRMLVELALGRDAYPFNARINSCLFPVPSDTLTDRAGELLAATAALGAAPSAAPEAGRLSDRIQGLVAELIASQNEDGGWPWVSGSVTANPPRPSDRTTTARVVWALSAAEPFGLLADVKAVDKASAFLTQQFAGAADVETRAVLLHALSTRRAATFEQFNSLNRARASLSDAGLAYLALTSANLDRAGLAVEVLDLLKTRVKTEPTQPGRAARVYWEGKSPLPFNRGPVEATALAALAFSRVRPADDTVAKAADWLLAHRTGTDWQPHKAKGPALAALAAYYGKAQGADDRYRLVVTVNDDEVLKTDVVGSTEGKAVLVPRRALRAGDKNRVRFHIEGRGTFGYAVTLTGFTRDLGPDQDRQNRTAIIDRRVYHAAAPELDGKTLPTGFGVALNPVIFGNPVSQLGLGGKASVEIVASRYVPPNQPVWDRDFLIVEEHVPAGATVIEGSVRTSASSYTQTDDVLTFYFAPDQWPGPIGYEVHGYLPGQYRALPASVRSAYEPGRAHLGPAGALKVLAPGEPNTDAYKSTPDELYARGKAHFDAGRLADAAEPLEALFAGYSLRDEFAKDAARMLLLISIRQYDPRKVVQYFEVVKEKAPELVLRFEDLLVIGRAYRDIKEFERAYLVWRGVVEASYLEDARVGEVLRQRGKTLEGIAYLIGLWRDCPDTAAIESDFFGLSQVLARHASEAVTNPALRRELAAANVTRSQLLLQSIRLTQTFLVRAPKDPLADEASLALVGDFLELEDFEAVVKLADRFAKLYPKSTFFDSFQYSAALGDFHLGRYDQAVAVAETIAKSTYKDANGIDQPSANKWQALYILGQIYDARRKPSRALDYYKQVADRFTDAGSAVQALTRKALQLPEVTVVRPGAGAAVALDYRNITKIDVKVYPVDLMRLYLTRRNLDAIAGIDLAGITPLLEKTIALGPGEDFEDRTKPIELPLDEEGAYLVMVRGGDLYASGVVLASPLEVQVHEEPASGRVRVTVRDAKSKEFVPKVQVKVIGSDNPSFLSGETDLRGVFVAEGVRGTVTAAARRGTAQYTLYRGKTYVGTPAAPNLPAVELNAPAAAADKPSQSLEENIMNTNSMNQTRQIERLQNRYLPGDQGGAAVKGFLGGGNERGPVP